MNIQRFLLLSLPTLGMLTLGFSSAFAQATHTSEDWAQSPAAFTEGNSLGDFQKRFHSALIQLNDRPEINQPLKLSANVTAASRTGIRQLRIRNFQILSDGDRRTAEFELGAGSWPSVVGALGSAVAGDFLTQAAVKGIPLDELEVVFTSRPGRAPSQSTGKQVVYPRNLTYTVFIVSSATDEELEDLRQTVERVSPVLNLVSNAQNIDHGKLIHIPTPSEPEKKTLAGHRDFLADKYAATQGAVPPESLITATSPRGNDWRAPLRAHIKVEGGTGIRHIRADTKNYQVIHDYPRYLAGNNLGPVPEEHILGTMITCLTHVYQIEASRKQIVIDTLELDVEGTLTTTLGNITTPPTYQNLHYTVRIGSPESEATIQELQQSVEAICPIYNMLKESQPIKGSIIRGPYTEEKERQSLVETES